MNRPLRIALLALILGGFALAVHYDFPLCPLASTLGIPCPGCGLTRATLALVHGDVRTALHLHPLVWLLSPLFIGFVGSAVYQLVRGPRPRRAREPLRGNNRAWSWAGACVLVLSLGVWLSRFAGYFGGPVPVTSLRDWLAR